MPPPPESPLRLHSCPHLHMPACTRVPPLLRFVACPPPSHSASSFYHKCPKQVRGVRLSNILRPPPDLPFGPSPSTHEFFPSPIHCTHSTMQAVWLVLWGTSPPGTLGSRPTCSERRWHQLPAVSRVSRRQPLAPSVRLAPLGSSGCVNQRDRVAEGRYLQQHCPHPGKGSRL